MNSNDFLFSSPALQDSLSVFMETDKQFLPSSVCLLLCTLLSPESVCVWKKVRSPARSISRLLTVCMPAGAASTKRSDLGKHRRADETGPAALSTKRSDRVNPGERSDPSPISPLKSTSGMKESRRGGTSSFNP